MTPTEYEHHIASLLTAEGWEVQVSPPQRDFGLDIVCQRPDRRLGIQVKMYGGGRPINAQIVMQLHGAAAYQDCREAMIVTDGRVLGSARRVAEKLNIEIRHVPVPDSTDVDDGGGSLSSEAEEAWTFDRVWKDLVMPLAGRVLTRSNGSTNEIISVDWSGLRRRSSNGTLGTIDIEIFRWGVERLLDGQVVLREEINEQYSKRASSGIMLVLESLPIFERVNVGSKAGIRRKSGR